MLELPHCSDMSICMHEQGFQCFVNHKFNRKTGCVWAQARVAFWDFTVIRGKKLFSFRPQIYSKVSVTQITNKDILMEHFLHVSIIIQNDSWINCSVWQFFWFFFFFIISRTHLFDPSAEKFCFRMRNLECEMHSGLERKWRAVVVSALCVCVCKTEEKYERLKKKKKIAHVHIWFALQKPPCAPQIRYWNKQAIESKFAYQSLFFRRDTSISLHGINRRSDLRVAKWKGPCCVAISPWQWYHHVIFFCLPSLSL